MNQVSVRSPHQTIDVLQRQAVCPNRGPPSLRGRCHAEEDTYGAGQRDLMPRGRFRAEAVLETCRRWVAGLSSILSCSQSIAK